MTAGSNEWPQCIDQDNADVKRNQINAMNLVYSNAHLTIIAAAGEDSVYGLPGVGLRQRVTQEHVCVDETVFVRTFPHASETLKTSRWATRGWTFQEGLLSNRKLIFTDQQVAFQCNGMHCSESVYWPFELMHAKSQRMFPQNVPAPLFRNSVGRKSSDQNKPYLNLTDHILEYSKRTLSHQSDRLNVILGILADWEARKEPIYHVWGVLVSPNFSWWGGGATGWDIRLGSWYHQEPCSRQPSFPSWSWAGWSGPLTKARYMPSNFSSPFRTELEKDRDGKAPERISLSTFVDDHPKHRKYATGSPFLQLYVKMLEIIFTPVRWSVSEAWKQAYYKDGEDASEPRKNAFKDGIYAEFPRRGYAELSYFYADDKDLNLASLPEQSMRAFLVESGATGENMRLIVVVPKGDHYERAGYLFCCARSVETHPDITYRRADGRLTKTRPEAPVGDDDDNILGLEDRYKAMRIRLG